MKQEILKFFQGIPSDKTIILVGESAAGKDHWRTQCQEYCDRVFAPSHVTRLPRSGEVDGKDYHFISNSEFDHAIASNKFIDWVEMNGNRYGVMLDAWNIPNGIMFASPSTLESIPQEALEDKVVVYITASIEVRKKRMQARTSGIDMDRIEWDQKQFAGFRNYDFLIDTSTC